MGYSNVPEGVSSELIGAPVNTTGDLPATGEANGQIRFVEAEERHMFWNASDNEWQYMDTIASGTSYTDEEAQDAIGDILASSDSIALAYDDSTPSITATIRLSGSSIAEDASGIYAVNDHTHANKAFLDVINQDLSTGSDPVFNRITITSGDWDDLIPTDEQDAAGASAPDLKAIPGYSNLTAFGFDGGVTTESRCYTFELAHDYKEGTDLYPHFHWCGSDNNAGNVIWNMDYAIFPVGTQGAALATVTTGPVANPGLGANNRAIMHISGTTAAISGTGLKVGYIIRVRVYRNPTASGDTYGSDAILIQPGMHYQKDTFGSRQLYVK